MLRRGAAALGRRVEVRFPPARRQARRPAARQSPKAKSWSDIVMLARSRPSPRDWGGSPE
jgi:hypothetical protein